VTVSEQKGNSEIQIYKMADLLKKDAALVVPPPILLQGVTQASWGNLNKTIYASTEKGSMNVIDINTRQSETHRIHKEPILSFTFTPDRLFLFTSSRDETYRMLDPETCSVITTYNFHGNIARAVAISPLYMPESKPVHRYHLLVVGGQDEKDVTTTRKKGGFEIKLVNYITSEELAAIKGHFGPVHSVAFSPDGKAFISGSEDGFVRLHFFHADYFTHKFE
jgi:translation initiation factor 3 subunit I